MGDVYGPMMDKYLDAEGVKDKAEGLPYIRYMVMYRSDGLVGLKEYQGTATMVVERQRFEKEFIKEEKDEGK